MLKHTQDTLIEELREFKDVLANSPKECLVINVSTVVDQLRQNRFRYPWQYVWWKEHKALDLKRYACHGLYSCSSCNKTVPSLVLQHNWHPTPLSVVVAGEVTITHIVDYFDKHIQELVDLRQSLISNKVRLVPAGCYKCGCNNFIEKNRDEWDKPRLYCEDCGRRRLERDPTHVERFSHDNKWYPSEKRTELIKKVEKDWFKAHLPLLVSTSVSVSKIIDYIDEKERYMALDPKDYDYTCKRCAYKEDVAFINGTIYSKNGTKDDAAIIGRIFNSLLTKHRLNVDSLRRALKDTQTMKGKTNHFSKSSNVGSRTIIRRSNTKHIRD
jgi:hypothetical protein